MTKNGKADIAESRNAHLMYFPPNHTDPAKPMAKHTTVIIAAIFLGLEVSFFTGTNIA